MILLPFALFAGMALANGSGQRHFAPHKTKSENPIPASYDNPFQKYFKFLHTEGLRTHFIVPCRSPDTEECSQEICAMHRAADDRYDCARVFHDYPGLARIVPALDKGLRPAKVRAKIRLRFCEPREQYPRKECFEQLCRVVDVRWPDRNLCAHEYKQYRGPASNADYVVPHESALPKFRDPNGWMWWESPESARRVGKRSIEDEPPQAVAAEAAEAAAVEPAEAAVAEPAAVAAVPGKALSHQQTRIANLIKKQEEYVKRLIKQVRKNRGNKKLERQLAAAKRRLLRLQARRGRRQRFENSGAARRQRIGEKKEDAKNKRLGVGEHDPKNKKKKAKAKDEDEDDEYESDDVEEKKKKKTTTKKKTKKTKKTKSDDEGVEEEEVEKKSKSKKTKSPKKTKVEDDEDEDEDDEDDDDLLEEELEIKENTSKTTKKKSKKKPKASKAKPGKVKSSEKKEKRGGHEFASAP